MEQTVTKPDTSSKVHTKYVGEEHVRSDSIPKVKGEATFAMDVQPGNLLHAKLVTSQVPHAFLENVDTTKAAAKNGVVMVVTADDIPDVLRGQYILDQPILARDKVRYVGEPIAIVVAESEAIAEQAVNDVDVEYGTLDAVFDVEEAFSREPPAVVHEDVRNYDFMTQGDPRYENHSHIDDHDADRPNLLFKTDGGVGDVDRAFETADHVLENEYEVKPMQHCAMEPHVVVGHRDEDGITLVTSQQVPHKIKNELCLTYPDITPDDVTVKTRFVGGGFGGKITPFLEVLLVPVLQEVDRPVRLQLTRTEQFTVGYSRPQTAVSVTDGVTNDGDLVARDISVKFNCGAYNEQVFKCTISGLSAAVGSYAIPNARWESFAVYTNLPRYGAFRGFGKPEVNWAIERHMDYVASKIGIDPVEYRRKNLLREGDENAKGEVLGPNDTVGCLVKPAESISSIDVPTEHPEYDTDEWRIGVGVGYGNKPVSRAVAPATVRIQKDMRIEVRVGAPDIGQGSNTMLQQIAAEEFDVEPETVSITSGDTDKTLFDMGPTGSRFTYHTGNALRKAANEAKGKLFSLAASLFPDEVGPEDLAIEDSHIVAGDDSIHVNELFSGYSQLAGVTNAMLKEGGELIGTATYDSRKDTEHAFWTPVGQAAIVAVNTITGETDVLRFCTACDVGKAINPKNVEQQLEGGAGQGIATALYEEIVYDNGNVVNPNFKDYRIPGTTELPYESDTIILESHNEEGPYGAQGVGEMGMVPAAPTIGNAVSNALGVEFDTIPITPERIVAALDEE